MTLLETDKHRWFCVRTQTKREHIAAKHLRELEGVEVFCPRMRYRRATRRGKVWWLEPHFPGYLLAKFDRDEMERAVTFCQGVRGLVRFGTEIPDIPDATVRNLIRQVREQAGGEGEEEMITIAPSISGDYTRGTSSQLFNASWGLLTGGFTWAATIPQPNPRGVWPYVLTLPSDSNIFLADLAASAPYAASRAGRVNLYAGHAGGPTTTPLARLTGPDGIQRGFGSSLASADVNGDGLSDLLVGTLPDGGNPGRLHVFLNGGSGIAALPSVSLDPPSPLRISEFATALAAVGDMDGDGYPEVVAGAPIPARATVDASVVIYRGGADGLVATRTWRIYSTIRTIDFGAGLLSDGQVASAGDVNGDGLADLAVGAPAVEDASTRGHVYVYLGRSTGPAAAPSTDLVGAGAWDVESFGRAAVGVGDVNGDGYGDLAVGAQGMAGQRVWIYPGSATGLVTTPMVTIPAPGSTGATTFFHGPYVTGAGDVNGDGYDDVAIGYASSTYGVATLHLGGPAGVAATPSTTLTGSTASYAFALAGPGDLDGDGYDDLVVAQPEAVFVYRGSAAGLVTVAATTLAGLDGPGSTFGTAVLGR
jgi:transcription antitermination factor NusG